MLQRNYFIAMFIFFTSASLSAAFPATHEWPYISCESKLLKNSVTTSAIWEKIQQSASIVQLAEKTQDTALPENVKLLLREMTQDCLSRGPKGNQNGPCWAYFSPTTKYIANVLKLGLHTYVRQETRSTGYAGPPGGYDRVHYCITHEDESVSHIVAYREEVDEIRALPGANGTPEFYPRRNLIYLSRGREFADNLILIQTSKGSLAPKAHTIPRAEAEDRIRQLFP